MHLRTLKELMVVIDLLINSLDKGDYVEILLKVSGIIFRDTESGTDKVHVSDALCKVTAEYTESGINVSSTTTKTVVKWLAQSKQGEYVRANSYLSFIDVLDSADITNIVYNSEEIIHRVTKNGKINLNEFLDFVNKDSCDYNITFENKGKKLPMLYTDSVFSRFVKLNGKCTMYINTEYAMDKFLDNYTIDNYMICYGVPCVTTRIEMYKNMAVADGCTFEVKTNNG